jgi:hypothetical protein
MQLRNIALVLFVVLTVVFASLSAYEYLQSQTFGTPNYQAVGRGMLERNGTLFEQVTIDTTVKYANGTLAPIANGTTITLREVAFTFIQKNFNGTIPEARFVVTSLSHGWNETLTIIAPGSPGPIIDEVFTTHTNPRAGLGMNFNSRAVYLLVSVTE